MIDTTQSWIRNVSDERAAENGCRFDVLRGAWAVWWIERYCKLYEGERYAGTPLILHGCHECDHSEFYALPEFDEEFVQERARLFCECVKAGHRIDWQYECLMRIFGWVVHSEHWEREVRRFRFASIWGAKKIKKTPTVSGIALYLTCGDGEPGNKVFLGGKDGEQIRKNMSEHIVAMRDQSPDLREATTLNKTTLRISHGESRSWLEPLSSSNIRTQKSKEGINGSVIIDETHVVDREFIRRISRAGISRPEPLQLEVSTAGNDPDGYGKEQFDKACAIISGEKTQQNFFAAVYAAPQDVTDEELDADPLKYGCMANPAMGHTIDPAEFLDDYNQSKQGTVEDFATCKMYRFNIWQQSSNPWLKDGEWKRCGRDYTEADLLGRVCYGGMDLSLTWDTTAFVLVFPWDGEGDDQTYRLWPYIFLPEESAKKTRNDVRWFDFEKAGHMKITDGAQTDFAFVRKTIVEASKKFELKQVAYDPKYAAQLAQELRDHDQIETIEFGQTPALFTEPIGLFEGLVKAGRIHHPRNECLSWQARNVRKKRNGMLQKPEEADIKKIDGIVASLMGLGRAMLHKDRCWNPADGIFL